MNDSKISVRYAKALFELANENDEIETIRQDVEIIESTVKLQDFNLLIENPVVRTSQKQKIFNELFKDAVSKNCLDFIKLIVKNKREKYLAAIVRNFLELYRNKQGIKKAVITSAVEIDRQTLEKVKTLLQSELKAKIEFKHEIKKEIIGGFILKVDDKQIDSSLATMLSSLKRELTEVSSNN